MNEAQRIEYALQQLRAARSDRLSEKTQHLLEEAEEMCEYARRSAEGDTRYQ